MNCFCYGDQSNIMERPATTTFINLDHHPTIIYWINHLCTTVSNGIPHVCRQDIVNGVDSEDNTVSYTWGTMNGVVNPDLGGYLVQEFQEPDNYLFIFAGPNVTITSRELLTHGQFGSLETVQTLIP